MSSTTYLVYVRLEVEGTSPRDAIARATRHAAIGDQPLIIDLTSATARKACVKCGRGILDPVLAGDEDERCARCGDS